ncbi:hypothetical protein ACJRO7_029539 [Eucalyptus globulus]|uniref:Uncharacterized protein n=1 Tax=Eucalyptus globulus TaxID=34317 RepID=A0ABD3JAC1_EUCGL
MGSICTIRESRMLYAENNDLVLRTARNGTGSSKLGKADFGEETHFGFDDSECVWLSSDCWSPRSILVDEYGLSGSCTLVDKLFSSWLSRVHLSNEGASLAFASTPLDFDFIHVGDLNDDADAENWLITSTEISRSPREILRNESAGQECLWSLSGSMKNLDSPSFPSSDEDTLSYLVSLVNLDEEDSKLFCDVDADLENFQSDFPSPSCRRSYSLGATSSISTGSSLLEATQGNSPGDLSSEDFPGIADYKNPNNEPFFWPFERKFDWDSDETARFLTMSPRKFILDHKNPRGTCCKPSVSNLLSRKGSLKEGSKTRMDQFSTRSGSGKRLELTNTGKIKAHRKVGNMEPSRLSGTAWRISAKTAPL